MTPPNRHRYIRCVTLLCLCLLATAAQAERQIRLQQILVGERIAQPDEWSDLLLLRADRTIEVKVPMVLLVGDSLSTGAHTVIVTFPREKAEVQIGPGSQLDLKEHTVFGWLGQLFVKLGKAARELTGGGFRVSTRYGLMAVKHTQFSVLLDEAGFSGQLFEGVIEIRIKASPDARPLIITPGQEIVVRQGARPIVRWMDRDTAEPIIERVRRVESILGPSVTGKRIPGIKTLPLRLDRAQTEELQARLLFLGYQPGTLDGQAGADTLQALRQFWRDQHRPGTPRADSLALEQLRQASRKKVPARLSGPGERMQGLKTPAGGKTYGPDFFTLRQLIECARADLEYSESLSRMKDLSRRIESSKKDLEAPPTPTDDTHRHRIEAHNQLVDKYNRFRRTRLEPSKRLLKKACPNGRKAWDDDLRRVYTLLGLKRFPSVRWRTTPSSPPR